MRAEYPSIRAPDAPEAFDDFAVLLSTDETRKEMTLRVLTQIMDSKRVGAVFNGMVWGVIKNRPRPVPVTDFRSATCTFRWFGTTRRACNHADLTGPHIRRRS
jgi:hypothetical protein